MPLLTVPKSKIVRRSAFISPLLSLFCCFAVGPWLLSSCSSNGNKPTVARPRVEANAAITALPNGSRVIKFSEVEAKRTEINQQEVKERPIDVVLHLTGHIEPDFGKEVDVSSRINGRVIKLFVKPGQTVRVGEVLAVIDSREISELQGELVEAKSKLQIAAAHREREQQIYEEQRVRPKALMEAQSKLEQAKIKHNLAEGEFKRQEGLYKEKIAATKDFLTAKANLATTALEYEQLASDLAREKQLYKNTALMRRDYQLADAEYVRAKQHFYTLEQHVRFMGMDKAATVALLQTGQTSGQINIVAPSFGVVSHEDVAVGEIVTPDKSLFKITDLTNVAVSVDVPEADLQHVKLGSHVKVKIASYPNSVFDATISYISDHVRRETRTLTMRAKLDNRSQRFKLNMYAEVDLIGPSRKALTCPKAAILERRGGKTVFVETKDGFEERNVTTGDTSGGYVEVKSGLSEGDSVVTSGGSFLETLMN